MNRTSKMRRAGAIAGCATALSLGSLAAALPASAATTTSAVIPFASQGCSGDVCISLSTPSNGKVTIRVWAYDTTFYGEFKLTGPRALVKTSPLNVNHAGGAGHTWVVNAIVGKYCATAYAYVNEEWIDLGTACENVE